MPPNLPNNGAKVTSLRIVDGFAPDAEWLAMGIVYTGDLLRSKSRQAAAAAAQGQTKLRHYRVREGDFKGLCLAVLVAQVPVSFHAVQCAAGLVAQN